MNFGRNQKLGVEPVPGYGNDTEDKRLPFTNALIGPELLKQDYENGGSRNERELDSAGSARTADCRTAASGLRQFGDCPTAQDGPAHGEGAL